MTPNYTLRKAKKEDCEALLTLIHELALYEKAPDEVTVTLEHMQEAGFGKNPVWEAFVIEKNEVIIGMSLYYIRYSTWKGKRLYLEDLIVTETERGFGYGKILLDKTIEYARENDFTGMMWQVLDWNEPAINFYKKYDTECDDEWINVSINF